VTRVPESGAKWAGYRRALEAVTRHELTPLEWASIHKKHGTMLSTLSERQTGMEHLEQAVSAYRVALEEYTHERVRPNWAMTQDNLGTALCRLGERESG